MRKSRVIIYTSAYNAEKTLCRAVESMITQSYEDWTYYILDNGSADKTGEIIKEYAASDRRVIPLKNYENKKLHLLNYLPMMLSGHGGDDLFCSIDADDEYVSHGWANQEKIVIENNLDAATCGTDWIDEITGEIVKHKVIDKNIILEGRDFAELFPAYRNFTVTVWGGVYKLDLLRKCNFEWTKNAMNFGDTAFCMELFRRTKRAGVLAESLHKYYISAKTDSYRYNPKWFLACKNLIEITREYLLDYGKLSRENEDYLCVLFLILIKYIMPRIEKADVDLPEKLNSLHEIFKDEMTQYMLEHWSEVGIYSDKGEFLREIKDWIIAQDGWEKDRPTVEKIILSMNI